MWGSGPQDGVHGECGVWVVSAPKGWGAGKGGGIVGFVGVLGREGGRLQGVWGCWEGRRAVVGYGGGCGVWEGSCGGGVWGAGKGGELAGWGGVLRGVCGVIGGQFVGCEGVAAGCVGC